MAHLVAPGTWAVQGRTVALPVRFDRARAAVALFRPDPGAAYAELRPAGLRPLIVGRRGVAVLMLVRYDEWELGAYDEVGVGLLVRGPGGPPGLHLLDLPVTGAFTREAGRDLWALPKWLMQCSLAFGPSSTEVSVADGDRPVFGARLRVGPLSVPGRPRASVPVWSRLPDGAQAGTLLRGDVRVAAAGVRVGRGRGGIRLDPGPQAHPMARRMAALGMTGRPVLVVHVAELEGVLGAFDPVRPAEG
jgi:hypothetical protein